MELAEPARVHSRCLPRMEELALCRLDPKLHVQRPVERLDDALCAEEPALDDAAQMPVLVRARIAGRQVDPGELEESDVFVPGIDVSAGRFEKTEEKRGAENRLLGGERDRQRDRV